MGKRINEGDRFRGVMFQICEEYQEINTLNPLLGDGHITETTKYALLMSPILV